MNVASLFRTRIRLRIRLRMAVPWCRSRTAARAFASATVPLYYAPFAVSYADACAKMTERQSWFEKVTQPRAGTAETTGALRLYSPNVSRKLFLPFRCADWVLPSLAFHYRIGDPFSPGSLRVSMSVRV